MGNLVEDLLHRRLDVEDHLILLRGEDTPRVARLLALGRVGARLDGRRLLVLAGWVRVLEMHGLVEWRGGGVGVDEDVALEERAADLLEKVDGDARKALARHARVRRQEAEHHRVLPHREGRRRHGDRRLVGRGLVEEDDRVREDVLDDLLARHAREREVVHVAIELQRLVVVVLRLRVAELKVRLLVEHRAQHLDRAADLLILARDAILGEALALDAHAAVVGGRGQRPNVRLGRSAAGGGGGAGDGAANRGRARHRLLRGGGDGGGDGRGGGGGAAIRRRWGRRGRLVGGVAGGDDRSLIG